MSIESIDSLPVHHGLVWEENGKKVDSAFLSHLLSRKVKDTTVTPIENHNGHTPLSNVKAIFADGKDPSELNMILKVLPSCQFEFSKKIGMAREALFFKELAPKLRLMINKDKDAVEELADFLPIIFFADGDMETGEKCVLMEDLTLQGGVQAGRFFGNFSPLNNDVDLKAEIANFKSSAEVITAAALDIQAQVHGAFWQKQSLLDSDEETQFPWLRGCKWIKGEDRENWEAAQKLAKDNWATAKTLIEEKKTTINYDPEFIAIVDKAVSNISWDSYVEKAKTQKFTLVHGDFHPANMMVMGEKSIVQDGTETIFPLLKMLDYEMIGVGSGPQEIGQFFLSHMNPKLRVECEERLVFAYYQKLKQAGVNGEDYTWQECWDEYIYGGVERFIWFLCYFSSGTVPDNWIQFFHDQIFAFMKDHKITVDTIGQPRV